jgi:hypothetical protein
LCRFLIDGVGLDLRLEVYGPDTREMRGIWGLWQKGSLLEQRYPVASASFEELLSFYIPPRDGRCLPR